MQGSPTSQLEQGFHDLRRSFHVHCKQSFSQVINFKCFWELLLEMELWSISFKRTGHQKTIFKRLGLKLHLWLCFEIKLCNITDSFYCETTVVRISMENPLPSVPSSFHPDPGSLPFARDVFTRAQLHSFFFHYKKIFSFPMCHIEVRKYSFQAF